MKTTPTHVCDRTLRTVKLAALIFALIASAYMMTLARASTDYRWLGWVTLLPLFFCIKTLRPLHAMWTGALWGLSLCVFSSSGAEPSIAPSLRAFGLLTAIPYYLAYNWLSGNVRDIAHDTAERAEDLVAAIAALPAPQGAVS